MAYKQSNNPISRKTSPLRDKGNHPHPHNKPGIISEDKLDLKSGSTSMHDGEKPSPKLASGDMSFEPHDKDYENYPNPWEEPDYEDPDYKPGMSRKSSSPLHDDKTSGSYDPYGDSDPFNTSKPSSVNEVKSKGTSDGGKIEKIETKPKAKFKPKTAKDADKVDSSGREGTNSQERKKRRKERKAIRKDKTLSRSQKAMAKKESRKKQKENVRGVKK